MGLYLVDRDFLKKEILESYVSTIKDQVSSDYVQDIEDRVLNNSRIT